MADTENVPLVEEETVVPTPEPTPEPIPEPAPVPEPAATPAPAPVAAKPAPTAAPRVYTDQNPKLQSGRLFSHILGLVSSAWDTRRSWLDEFCDTAEFGFPNFSTLSRRVSRNFKYFQSNYLLVATACVLLSVLNAALGFIFAVFFLYLIDKHAARNAEKGTTTDKQRLIYVLLILLVFWVTEITDELLMAGVVAAGIVTVHAVFHVPQEGTVEAEMVGETAV